MCACVRNWSFSHQPVGAYVELTPLSKGVMFMDTIGGWNLTSKCFHILFFNLWTQLTLKSKYLNFNYSKSQVWWVQKVRKRLNSMKNRPAHLMRRLLRSKFMKETWVGRNQLIQRLDSSAAYNHPSIHSHMEWIIESWPHMYVPMDHFAT